MISSDKNNSFWLSLQFIISLLFSLITLKLNISHYGEYFFGIWIALASIWGLGSALDFGFGTALLKYVAEYHNHSKRKMNVLLSSSYVMFFVNGLLVLLLGMVLGYFFYLSNDNIIPSYSINKFWKVFAILGGAFYLKYLTLFFKAVVEGLSNFIITSKYMIIQSTIVIIGVIIVTILKLNIIYLAIVYFVSSLVLLILFILYFKKHLDTYKLSFKYFSIKQVKEIFGFSFSIQMMSIFGALIDPIIKYLLGSFYSISSVPAYEIARKFAVSISGLFFNAFKVILPKASVLQNYNEINLFINTDVMKYCKIGIAYSGIAFGVFALPIVYFIKFFFGINEAILIFIILALPESINNFGYSIYNFLIGVSKVSFLASLQFINLIFVIVGLIIGFNIFGNSLGLLGYFFSVLIANIMMIIYLKKEWKVSPPRFLFSVGITKLVILIITLFITIVLLYNALIPLVFILLFNSFISLIVFRKDLLLYAKLFYSLTLNKLFIEKSN